MNDQNAHTPRVPAPEDQGRKLLHAVNHCGENFRLFRKIRGLVEP
jgi:hypothetical protein